jgi:hypothetical protein
MKKTKAMATPVKKSPLKAMPEKKSAPRPARTRSVSRQAAGARAKVDQDVLVGALTELVKVSIEIRELLTEIRDGLAEAEEAAAGEVDTVVIAEAENPESSEDEF